MEGIAGVERSEGTRRTLRTLARRIVSSRDLITLAMIVIFAGALSLSTSSFLRVSNIRAMAIAMSMEMPVVIGMMALLILGDFDLSVGSVSALGAVVTTLALVNGVPMWLAIAAGLGSGLVVGLVNGFLVTQFRMNALIVTLGTQSIASGIALGTTGGVVIASGLPSVFAFFGAGKVWGFPVPVMIGLVCVAIADVLLRNISAFRHIYYIGSNKDAAVYAGIGVNRARLLAFTLMGVLGAMVGIIVSSRVMAGSPTLNLNLPLRLISACIIGGASLSGGEGTMVGALLGLTVMHILSNGMVLLNISVYWGGVVIGLVLIFALAIDIAAQRLR